MDKMLTYNVWRAEKAIEIAEHYRCTLSDALLNVDRWRWYTEHVQPLIRQGVKPTTAAVCKSLVQYCPYGPSQLCREFLAAGHGDNFWPSHIDLSGNVIKRTMKRCRKQKT
jgi:hypothetical protein